MEKEHSLSVTILRIWGRADSSGMEHPDGGA